MVRHKIKIICFAMLLFLTQTRAAGESPALSEYHVKAAVLYNFFKFIDWPPNKESENKDVFVIGILGAVDPFGSAFDDGAKEPICDRKLVVRQHGSFGDIAELKQRDINQYNEAILALRNCHILFICSSEARFIPQIFEAIVGAHVLTVGESRGFLESGGIANFILQNEKIGFEFNLVPCREAKIEIRSQLLRIAKRVIGKDKEDDKK